MMHGGWEWADGHAVPAVERLRRGLEDGAVAIRTGQKCAPFILALPEWERARLP
jgi:hypothetical protein